MMATVMQLRVRSCVPGDINTFMYPSSGAEANEAAIRMARLMTGRSKIFTRCVCGN